MGDYVTLKRVAIRETFVADLANMRSSFTVDACVNPKLFARGQEFAALETGNTDILAMVALVMMKMFQFFGERQVAGDTSKGLSAGSVQIHVKV